MKCCVVGARAQTRAGNSWRAIFSDFLRNQFTRFNGGVQGCGGGRGSGAGAAQLAYATAQVDASIFVPEFFTRICNPVPRPAPSAGPHTAAIATQNLQLPRLQFFTSSLCRSPENLSLAQRLVFIPVFWSGAKSVLTRFACRRNTRIPDAFLAILEHNSRTTQGKN